MTDPAIGRCSEGHRRGARALDNAHTRVWAPEGEQLRLQKIKDNLNQNRFARSQYVHGQLHKAVNQSVQAIVRYELGGTDGNMALKFWIDEQALAQAAAAD